MHMVRRMDLMPSIVDDDDDEALSQIEAYEFVGDEEDKEPRKHYHQNQRIMLQASG